MGRIRSVKQAPDYPDPASTCPCGSGKIANSCCYDGSRWHKTSTKFVTKEMTGLITPGCYAASLRDCDGNVVTKEHVVSKVLLKEIGATFPIQGHSTIPDGKSVSPKSLCSHVLCGRHNSMLSQLDIEAGRLFTTLKKYFLEHTGGFALFSGDDIERWLLKVHSGLIASDVPKLKATDRGVKQEPDRKLLNAIFGSCILDPFSGMGLAKFGQGVVKALDINFFSPGKTNRIDGTRVRIYGVAFVVSLVKVNTKYFPYQHRPGRVILNNELTIEFSWERYSAKKVCAIECHSQATND